MFYALGMAMSLAVLFLSGALASAVSALLWRYWARHGWAWRGWALHTVAQNQPPQAASHDRQRGPLLLLLRLFPLLFAVVFTLGFALPAYLRFEPVASGEAVEPHLTALALLGGAVLLLFAGRLARILLATWRLERSWKRQSSVLSISGTRVFQFEGELQLVAAAGILRPQIFISRSVAGALSAAELAAAIEHERAHIRSFDNLKQLLLKVTRPPRWMVSLHQAERAWSNQAEVAADRRAVEGGASALDLSAALVKVCRMHQPQIPIGKHALASHLVPGDGRSAVEARVTQLRHMLDGAGLSHPHPHPVRSRLRFPIVVALAVLVYVLVLPAILPAVHQALEFLVQ
jgi:Zn-dependent protease with chaperone function